MLHHSSITPPGERPGRRDDGSTVRGVAGSPTTSPHACGVRRDDLGCHRGRTRGRSPDVASTRQVVNLTAWEVPGGGRSRIDVKSLARTPVTQMETVVHRPSEAPNAVSVDAAR